MTRKLDPAVRDLLTVAQAWAHKDDWSVPSIYIGTLRSLAEELAAGDEPAALARHAKHTNRDCLVHLCAERIPFAFSSRFDK